MYRFVKIYIVYNFYLVASSKIKIDGLFNKALAIAIRCF